MIRLTLALSLGLVLAGCPKKQVTIYRSLSEPGAMQTCDANKQFTTDVKGQDEEDAREKGAAQIQDTVRTQGGCGALIVNDGAGKALDGTYNYSASYQLCNCQ